MPGTLLVSGGRLTGALDAGGLAPADPPLDLGSSPLRSIGSPLVDLARSD
nr:hypothetical protein [Mycolicibacterium sp. P9-64]